MVDGGPARTVRVPAPRVMVRDSTGVASWAAGLNGEDPCARAHGSAARGAVSLPCGTRIPAYSRPPGSLLSCLSTAAEHLGLPLSLNYGGTAVKASQRM